MKYPITRAEYAQLEQVCFFDQKIVAPKYTLQSRLQNIWYYVLSRLANSPELQVWRHVDRDGRVTWCGQDRLSGKYIHGLSEEEMRIWVEESYR